MSIEGTANTEYASLSGKIRTFVIDKSLTISGACADAKAVGDAFEAVGVIDLTKLEAEVAKKAVTETRYATVTTNWTAKDGYYYQDIPVNGIITSDNPVADIMPSEDNDANTLYEEAMCKVFRITTAANSIRVWATEAINIAFPIQLKVVR